MITNDDREYAITELSEAITELKGHMDDEALYCIHSAQGALIVGDKMRVETFSEGTRIELSDIVDISIRGYVRLVREDNGISVIVDSTPMMFIPNVNMKDIISDITIELEPTF